MKPEDSLLFKGLCRQSLRTSCHLKASADTAWGQPAIWVSADKQSLPTWCFFIRFWTAVRELPRSADSAIGFLSCIHDNSSSTSLKNWYMCSASSKFSLRTWHGSASELYLSTTDNTVIKKSMYVCAWMHVRMHVWMHVCICVTRVCVYRTVESNQKSSRTVFQEERCLTDMSSSKTWNWSDDLGPQRHTHSWSWETTYPLEPPTDSRCSSTDLSNKTCRALLMKRFSFNSSPVLSTDELKVLAALKWPI